MDAPSPPNMPNPNMAPGGMPAEQMRPQSAEQHAAPQMPAAPEVAPAGGVQPATPPPIVTPQLDPMALAMAAPVTPAPVPTPTVATPLPNLAADVDVIEPEWVDKAEEVVRAHLGDPYGEEEAVETLQEDYLQKRYGFSVHEPDDDTTKTDTV